MIKPCGAASQAQVVVRVITNNNMVHLELTPPTGRLGLSPKQAKALAHLLVTLADTLDVGAN